MLYIESPSDSKLDKYYLDVKDKISLRLSTAQLSDEIITYLSNKKIERIIKDKPNKLILHHIEFMTRFVDLPQNDIAQKEQIFAGIKSVLDYKEIISDSKSTSYELAKITNRNTCTYCNRLYTNTVEYRDPQTNRINVGTRITRAVFDHWFCKKEYPLLALSFYNLIPSCSVCNTSIKGDDEFGLSTHIHPYIDNVVNHFSFSYKPKSLFENEIVIKQNNSNDKLKRTLDELKIKEVYDAHSNLELKDLIDLNEKYNENYIDTLFNSTFSNLNMKEPEIYRLIFGIESQESDFYKRPFSKFKKDIIKELREVQK
jgi:hypothetical protein